LSQHDVFGHTLEVVLLGKNGGFEQNFGRFFERATHEGSGFDTIDTVSGDTHQMPSICHDVRQNSKMSIIDVTSIKTDDSSQFFEQRVSDSFYSQDLDDLDDVIRSGSRVIHFGA